MKRLHEIRNNQKEFLAALKKCWNSYHEFKIIDEYVYHRQLSHDNSKEWKRWEPVVSWEKVLREAGYLK